MAFREVPVFEVREVLRLWIGGEGFRSIDRLTRVDRKTVRRYVEAAVAVGVTRDGGQGQLSDEMLGAVIVAARPVRPGWSRGGLGGAGRSPGAARGVARQ